MNKLFLNVANFVIEIKFIKTEWPYLLEKGFAERIEVLFKGFITKKSERKPEYVIQILHRPVFEVMFNKKSKKHFINYYEESGSSKITTFYHISEIQMILIMRKVLQNLLKGKNGLIFHGSASKISGKACVFLGISGAGKSTIMQLLSRKFTALADDSAIIKKEGKKFMFYQTPFKEAHDWFDKTSKGYELGGLFLLEKGNRFDVKKIEDKELVIDYFLEHFLTEKEDAKDQVKTLLDLIANFGNIYKLKFSIQEQLNLMEELRKLKL